MWNANGLLAQKKSKLEFLKSFDEQNNLTFIIITETHLRNDMHDGEITQALHGFSLLRCDRNTDYDKNSAKSKGGTAILYPSDICPTKVQYYSNGMNENLNVEFKELCLSIIAIYRPPGATKHQTSNTFKHVDTFLSVSKMGNIVLGGDLNFPKEFVTWKHKDYNNHLSHLIPTIIGPTADDEDDDNDAKDKRAQAQQLFNIASAYGLQQFVSAPTNNKNILDLMYINTSLGAKIQVIPSNPFSDHDVVAANINILLERNSYSSAKNTNSNRKRKASDLNLKHVNWEQTIAQLEKSDFEKHKSSPIQHQILVLSEIIYDALVQNGATVRPKGSAKKHPQLDTKTSHRLKHLRKLLDTKVLLEHEREAVLEEINVYNSTLAREAKHKSAQAEEEVAKKVKNDPAAFYKYVNSFKKNKDTVGPLEDSFGNIISDPKVMADMLNKEFLNNFDSQKLDINELKESLRNDIGKEEFLFNLTVSTEDVLLSLDSSKNNNSSGSDGLSNVVIKKLKIFVAPLLADIYNNSIHQEQDLEATYLAEIVPIFKKGIRSEARNYRPIAKTSVLSKVLERIIIVKVRQHLLSHGFIADAQYGFTPNRSLQMNLLRHKNFIMKQMKEYPDATVCSLYIDFSKAFQKVNHVVLMTKLRKYKVGGLVGLWLLRWLTNRKMFVSIDGHYSEAVEVTSGVGEGTVAGPELFKILLMDIPTHDNDDLFLLLSFADDTNLSRVIRNESDLAIFQTQIHKLYTWAAESRMIFNSSKFQAICFKDKRSLNGTKIEVINNDNNLVQISDVVTDLGVLFDDKLTFNQELNKVVQKCNKRSYWILRTFRSRDPAILMPIFKSMVTSLIDFSSLMMPSPSPAVITRLEDVQRKFTSKLNNMKDKNYEDRLQSLKLFSIQRRKERGLLLFMQKLSLMDPSVAGFPERKCNRYKEINYHVGGHSYSGVSWKANKSWVDGVYNYSAAYVGTRLYNGLPIHVKSSSDENAGKSFDQLKRLVDSYLGKFPDRPSGSKKDNRLLSLTRRYT